MSAHQDTARLFGRWNEGGEGICLIAENGQAFSRADIANLGGAVTSLAEKTPALVFIEGRNTPSFIAAYVAAIRAGLAVHVLDPARGEDNASLEALFRPLAVVSTSGPAPLVRLTGLPRPAVHPDLALLLPTSGTTGSSKMAKISNRAIAANTAAIIEYLAIDAADCAITTLKPFYSFGISVLNTHLEAGAKVILNDASIENPDFWKRAQAHAATNFAGVPYTFELLAKMPTRLETLTSLRFLAQAGGRLTPELVRKFAKLGARSGWNFFVMYGQTEASPRISYLPPDLAEQFPDSIGRPIPGGRMWIADEHGQSVETSGIEGELHYAGPNVMSGYACDAGDLAELDILPALATGDIARRLPNGLFVVTGRRSRFVKPFGLRVSLDGVEALLASHGVAAAATAQEDRVVVLTVQKESASTPSSVRDFLAQRLKLPLSLFDVREVNAIPLLPNEKIDRRAVASIAAGTRHGGRRQFLREVRREFAAILNGGSATSRSVFDIFIKQFGERVHAQNDNFVDLGGDSMAAVTFAIQLEEMLGVLPDNWPSLSISQLEALRRTQLG